jgi:hypothetical protein
VDIDSLLKKDKQRRECVTGVLPLTVGDNVIPLTVGPTCGPMGLRRQMEFNGRKNRELREKLKEIIQKAERIHTGLGEEYETLGLAHDIRQLALDVLVEL